MLKRTSTVKRFAPTSTLTLAAQTSMRTYVDFNVGRTNVAGALTSAAQTSMRTNVDYHLRRCSLLSVAQNSRHLPYGLRPIMWVCKAKMITVWLLHFAGHYPWLKSGLPVRSTSRWPWPSSDTWPFATPSTTTPTPGPRAATSCPSSSSPSSTTFRDSSSSRRRFVILKTIQRCRQSTGAILRRWRRTYPRKKKRRISRRVFHSSRLN